MAVCASCGHEAVAEFRFCPECGAPAERALADGVRKTVSVVFCDLVGSTALGDSSDPEAVRALLGRYFTRMRSIVERHGGTVEKFIGDAVVAVFGVPAVHEDDALRACRAATEMRDALPGLGIRGRLGVNTGEVMTSTDDLLASGDTMNVAARLEQAAPVGEVLIGEPTYTASRQALEVEPVEPLALKGKAAPVAAYRLLSVLPVPERSHGLQFVGRDEELERILAAWRRAMSDGRCELLTVVGDAGVGKSRLVSEGLAQLTGRVVRGRCLPYGDGITYWPVVEILKQLAALPTDPAAAAAINTLLGTSNAGSSPDEIAWAFRKLLEEQAPLAVVFDDLQWGEETFLDLVESTALLSTGEPLLLVCMARPELLQRRPGWPGVMALEPLGRKQADALIGDAIAPDLRERIAEAAGGNPLFISEMLAMAAEQAEIEVPPTLKALLEMRLDQLDEAERKVLERGSVEGEIFHRGAVQALAPEESRVDVRLAALVRHQLVRPDRAQLAGDDGYRFRHLLIRDAAYEALPKSTRAELHRRFATWLGVHGSALVELDEILGYHLERAAVYLAELGQPNPVLNQEAAGHLAAAGVRARLRHDVRAARSLLKRSIALEDQPDVHLLVHYAAVEDSRLVAPLLEDAARRAEFEGDAPSAALARAEAVYLRMHAGEATSDDVERLALDALNVLEAVEDHAGLSTVWFLISEGVHNSRSQFDEMGRAAEEGLRHAALAGHPQTPDYAMSMITALHYGRTPVPEALQRVKELAAKQPHPVLMLQEAVFHAMNDDLETARKLAAAGEARFLELSDGPIAALMRAEIEALAGDFRGASELLGVACERFAARGQTTGLATYAPLRGLTLCAIGRFNEAEKLAEQGRELGLDDDVITQALWRRVSALVHAQRGALGDAERLAREAVDEAYKSDSHELQAGSLTDLGEVLRASERNVEATAALREALQLYERKGIIPLARRTRERLAALEHTTPSTASGVSPPTIS